MKKRNERQLNGDKITLESQLEDFKSKKKKAELTLGQINYTLEKLTKQKEEIETNAEYIELSAKLEELNQKLTEAKLIKEDTTTAVEIAKELNQVQEQLKKFTTALDSINAQLVKETKDKILYTDMIKQLKEDIAKNEKLLASLSEIPSAKETGLIRRNNQKKNKNKKANAEEVKAETNAEAKPEESKAEEKPVETKPEENKADDAKDTSKEIIEVTATVTAEETKKPNKFVTFVKTHKNKIVALCLSLVAFGGGVTLGSGVTSCSTEKDNRTVDNLEDANTKILHTLNETNLTTNKVVEIDGANILFDDENGKVKLLAKALNASGNEYNCSFTFTGDKDDAEKISEMATSLAQQDLSYPKKGSKTLGQLIDYFTEIGEFVEENKDTAEYQKEVLPTEVLKDGEKSYEGIGALDRIYEHLSEGGLKDKADADKKVWDNIKHAINDENYKFETKFVVDAKTKEAIAVTEISKDGIVTKFGFKAIVPEDAITATKSSEIKAEMETYLLNFLKSNKKDAVDLLDCISEVIIEDGCSNKVFAAANNLINEETKELSK